jgi:hypothetical protein
MKIESGMKERMKTIHFVSPSRMEQLLAEAGFHRVQRFFQNFMVGAGSRSKFKRKEAAPRGLLVYCGSDGSLGVHLGHRHEEIINMTTKAGDL